MKQKNKRFVVRYHCPSCKWDNDITVYPIIPASATGPAEGGDYDPVECDRCGEPITPEDLYHQFPDLDD